MQYPASQPFGGQRFGLNWSMTYIIDRFEDNDMVVLETENGEHIDVPRPYAPPEAKEGDVLVELPESELDGDVKYAVNYEQTERRKNEAERLRASLPTFKGEGDIEL